MLNLFRNGAVGFIDWLDGRRGSTLNVMARSPNLALARRVATLPALQRLKAEAALRARTSTAETNRKVADMTSAVQAAKAGCRAALHTRGCDEPSSL
jgi:hypothetical protein